MIQSIRRCKRQQATGEAKTDSCEGQSNLVAGAQIQVNCSLTADEENFVNFSVASLLY